MANFEFGQVNNDEMFQREFACIFVFKNYSGKLFCLWIGIEFF